LLKITGKYDGRPQDPGGDVENTDVGGGFIWSLHYFILLFVLLLEASI